MLLIVAAWSFAEAILFFFVADVPITAVAVASGWRRGAAAAGIAALAASAGGAVLYGWAAVDPDAARAAILALPAIDAWMVEEAARRFGEGGYSALLAGSLTGVPYKLFVLAAAAEGRALLPFLLASALLRLPRFLIAALLSAAIGKALSRWLSLRSRLGVLGAFWILFYTVYFTVTPA